MPPAMDFRRAPEPLATDPAETYLDHLFTCGGDTMIGVLGLEDGTRVEGVGFGAPGVVSGELVFATVISGYEEAMTDPSYRGQLLMFTYPLMGNYGVSGDNFQSDRIGPTAIVCREIWDRPLHHRSTRTISQFLEEEGIPGIFRLDTRMLTIKIRDQGAMRAALAVGERSEVAGEDVVAIARDQPEISTLDLISAVSCRSPHRIPGEGPKVVMIDLGIKRSILDSMRSRGFDIVVLPSNATVSEIEGYEPDALFISNGPGDPKQATEAIEAVKHFAGERPIYGICLGLQVICLALGAETYKLKFGHHGGNQPVKDLATGVVRITSQNHNFALRPDSAEGTGLEITQVNANDGTVEGIRSDYLGMEAVQYHPEARPGPLCTRDRFFGTVAKEIEARRR